MMVDTLTAKSSELPGTRTDGPYRNPYNIPREPVMALDSQPLTAQQSYASNPSQQSYNQSNYFLHQQNPIYPPVSHHGSYYNNQGYNGYYSHNNFHNNGQNKNSELAKFRGDHNSGPAQSSQALSGQTQRQESSPDSIVSASSPESEMSPPLASAQFQPQDQSDSHVSPRSKQQDEPRRMTVHDQQPLFPGPEAPADCGPEEHLSPQPGDTPPLEKQDVIGSSGENDRHQEQHSPVPVKEELKDDTPPPSLIPPPGSFDKDNRQSDLNVSGHDEEKFKEEYKVEPQTENAQDNLSDAPLEKDPNAPLDPNASEGDAQQEQGETNISKLEAAVRENLEQAIKQHNVQRSTNHGPPFLTSPPIRPDSHGSDSSPMKDPVLKDLPRPEELFPSHRPSHGAPGSPRGGAIFPPPHMPFHNIFQRALSEPGFRPGGPGDMFNPIRTPTSASPPASTNLSIPPSFPRPPPSQPLPQFMNHSQSRDIPPSPHKPTDFTKAKTPEGSMSSVDSKLGGGDGDQSGEYFYCHLCSYVGTAKSAFNEHMDSHFEHRCPECDYTSRTEGRLKRHIKDFHCDDDNLRREPGRPKTFRCRQCDFVAKEKEEYWSHARTHIKDDKVLQCPKCPFVTEYKHHLEYHLRNHFGSKPFKCTKCNYSCVNKSMLNSHMKSHTNVYQYRCADCTYATKYCHSLKLHLQKYNHTPALVLNPDGSLPTDGSGDFELVSKRGPPRGPRGPRKLGEKELPPGHPMMHMDPGMMFAHAGLNGHSPLNMIAAATGGFWPGMMPSGLQPPPPLIPVSQMNPLHIQMPGQDAGKHTPQPHIEVEKKKCKMCDFAVESRHALAEHMMKVHAAEHRDILQILGMQGENPMAAMAAAAAAKVAEQQHALMKAHGLTTPTKDPNEMAKAWGMMQKGMHPSPPTPHTPSTPGSQTSPRYPEEYTPHSTPNKTDYRNQMAMEIAEKIHSHSNGKNGDGALDLTNKSEQNGSSALDFSPGAKRRLYEEDGYVGSSRVNVISGSDSNPNTPMGAVNGNASPPRKRSRKGKAYKLDVLSMKLQEKYSTSPAPGMDYEDSIDEDAEYPSDYPSSDRGDSNDCNTNGYQENCDGRETPDYKALQESIRALNSGEPHQHYEMSPKAGDDHPADDSATEKMDGATMFSSAINRKKIMVERPMESERQAENCPVENNADSTNDLPKPNDADKYECQHCDISFKDCIMYTMHMGYHGYQHPFKCNMCGQLCENKVDFFLHIARTAHE